MIKLFAVIIALLASVSLTNSETNNEITRKAVVKDTVCLDDSVCYNGASCIAVEGETGAYGCNCTAKVSISSFAGLSCEYEATEYCFFNSPGAAKITFCTNGQCKEIYQAEDGKDIEHRGCHCDEGFEGDYCEYKKGSMPSTTLSTTREQNIYEQESDESKPSESVQNLNEPEYNKSKPGVDKTYAGILSFTTVLIAAILIIGFTFIKGKRESAQQVQMENQTDVEII